MNITAINSVAPIVSRNRVANTPEGTESKNKEITQLPSLNFCAAYATNIKMPTFDSIAEKSKYFTLKEDLGIDASYFNEPINKKIQWKESTVTVSEDNNTRTEANFYTLETHYANGVILREQISDNTSAYDKNTHETKVNNDIGKYQTIWAKYNDNYIYAKKIDNNTVEVLHGDNKNDKIWHYKNMQTNTDVEIDTELVNQIGFSNDDIFKKLTGYEEEASYGPSLRSYYAVNLAKGIEV